MINCLNHEEANSISFQRAKGRLELSFVDVGGETTLSHLHQSGVLKALIPKSTSNGGEAIVINTGGGIVGGDQLSLTFVGEENTNTWITTQAYEKVYKSNDEISTVATNVKVGKKASLYWCPQDTILFDRSKLKRTLNFSIDQTSNLLAIENIIFGRIASGEFNINCYFSDQWRIKRDQELVFAENFLYSGNENIGRKANLANNKCVCNMIYVSEYSERYLNQVRRFIKETELIGGASCRNNCMVVRVVAEDPGSVRPFTSLVTGLFSNHGESIPRVLSI